MFAYELEGFKRLKIEAIRWGSSYRVKVRGKTGKMVYVSNLSRPSNRKLVAKQYGVSEDKLSTHLSSDYKADPKYRFYSGNHMETHLYENIQPGEFYDKLENVLNSQQKASRINIALGYILISKSDHTDENYFYPNIANTSVFDKPVAINSKGDIRKKVISEIRSMELADRLNYPKSGYQLKSIVAFKIYIYHRDHALGSSEAVIPKVIKDNKAVINFPKTNNKCVFHCIAYHTQTGEKKDPRRISGLVKAAFKRYFDFKGIGYSLGIYRSFKPLDILQFDDLEECFQLAINVYTYDVESGKTERIRQSDKDYDMINILSHEKHALYIKDIDMFLSKYQCPKCEMVFPSADKLRNHKKNKCEEVNVESFPAKPTIYRPNQNTIKSLLTKYSIKGPDHYLDHFIVYDFEAILKPIINDEQKKTTIDNEHIPVSVSICDSITEEERCFVDNQPRELLTKMFDYIKSVGSKVFNYNIVKYDTLIRKIIEAHGLTGMDIPGAPLGTTYKLKDINQWIEEEKYSSFFDFCDQVSGTHKTDYGKLMQLFKQVPVLGFNSGRYDINLIKNDLFSVLGTDNIVSVIKNPSYMCIATHDTKMLDISNYVPAGTSYSKYLSTYLGGCQCDDKIRCVCGLGKGIFCYEYITDIRVLNRTQIPPKSALDSKLRDTKLSNEDYERVKFVWEHCSMKTIMDLLIWYNNLDVKPFVKAIQAQRELFKRFDQGMFADGVSLCCVADKENVEVRCIEVLVIYLFRRSSYSCSMRGHRLHNCRVAVSCCQLLECCCCWARSQ